MVVLSFFDSRIFLHLLDVLNSSFSFNSLLNSFINFIISFILTVYHMLYFTFLYCNFIFYHLNSSLFLLSLVFNSNCLQFSFSSVNHFHSIYISIFSFSHAWFFCSLLLLFSQILFFPTPNLIYLRRI